MTEHEPHTSDLTDLQRQFSTQDDRLKFESLLSDLSATFINLPPSDVDRTIELGLEKVVHFLGFDRSSIWLFSTVDGKLHMTHSYGLAGIKPPPEVIDEQVPLWMEMVFKGELFRISDVDEMPDSHWREKEYCRAQGGIRSFLFMPLNVGGRVIGLMSFASYRAKRTWPDVLVQRMRLLWEVFANALERKRADTRIQQAMLEIEKLKDRLEAENTYLRDLVEVEHRHEGIVGRSEGIRRVLAQVEQVGPTGSSVLITGETGTGKELVARAIHACSSRRDRPMVRVNCAALPSTLIESELFGREKGAYTGALTSQAGRFEAADGSTIFLDEIGELPLELQGKLLRVLQEGQFERLGSTKTLQVNVRVVAATNRNLQEAIGQGRFREDLYYRLNVFPLRIPPLRERREDISLIAWSMVREFEKVFGKKIERIPAGVMQRLENYAWPGNVRELRNLIERAMILSKGDALHVDFPEEPAGGSSQLLSLEEMNRKHLLAVLTYTNWRIRGPGGAADILQMKPTTLESKMKRLSISRPA